MQKIVIRHKAPNKDKASFLECKITPQTKVSSLKAAIHTHFGMEPAEQLLIYDPNLDSFPSASHVRLSPDLPVEGHTGRRPRRKNRPA